MFWGDLAWRFGAQALSRMAMAVACFSVWLRLMWTPPAARGQQGLAFAVQHDVGLAGFFAADFHVLPAQLRADAGAKGLGDGFLAGKARRQKRARAICARGSRPVRPGAESAGRNRSPNRCKAASMRSTSIMSMPVPRIKVGQVR